MERFQKLALIALPIIVVFSLRLSSYPHVNWDEGWTFAVARNYVEYGHYGQIRDGVHYGPGLSASFPIVLPIIMSFNLFGIGVWQGRLPGLVISAVVIVLIYEFSGWLFGKKNARITLGFLFTLPLTEQIHPMLFGRQALGEMWVLFYLLLGFLFLRPALTRHPAWTIPASLCWALALLSKIQPIPFMIAAYLLTLLIALFKRHAVWWKILLPAGLATSVFYFGLGRFFFTALLTSSVEPDPVEGLVSASAFTLIPAVREWTLFLILTVGLSVAAGLVRQLSKWPGADWGQGYTWVTWMYYFLAASWMSWYALFSVNWPRYFLPPLLLGSIFAASLWTDWFLTAGFRRGLAAAASVVRNRVHNLGGWKALCGFILITTHFTFLGISLSQLGRIAMQADPLVDVVAYLNGRTPQDAVVETYESPILFLLDRPVHFPPNQEHVLVNRRLFLLEDLPFAYDPLIADPDFLVIGEDGRRAGIYTRALEAEDFSWIASFPPYEIYKRTR